MGKLKWLALSLPVVVVLAGVLLVVGPGFWPGGSLRHPDGGGPLGSEGAPAPFTKANDPEGGAYNVWTDGIRLCLFSGNEPAVLDSVSPDSTVGSGFNFLGAKVREFEVDWTTHQPIISVFGYPPPKNYVPDPLFDVKGFQVTSLCTQPPTGSYTELLIGFGRVGDDGGGWQGIDISYSVAGHPHILVLDDCLLVCGASVTMCTPPGASS
jgi:hypothetical protein